MEWLICAFFVIAVLYSSVGFGGGSSYIALLLAFGLAVEEVRFIALVCNIIVVGSSVVYYHRSGLLRYASILPLIGVSVPMAFLGGRILLEAPLYKLMAGSVLIIAAVVMFITRDGLKHSFSTSLTKSTLSLIGGVIGFLSGIIGIGGGIFLSPVLHLMRWETAKIISATASLFILVNSLAGLFGQLTTRPDIDVRTVALLGGVVLIGGRIGNHLSIQVLKPSYIRLLTAVLIAAVGIRLLITYSGL